MEYRKLYVLTREWHRVSGGICFRGLGIHNGTEPSTNIIDLITMPATTGQDVHTCMIEWPRSHKVLNARACAQSAGQPGLVLDSDSPAA